MQLVQTNVLFSLLTCEIVKNRTFSSEFRLWFVTD